MNALENKNILVTGGTGSFGKTFVKTVLRDSNPARVVVFSRDELKQFEMAQDYRNEPRIRFFIGDVRDKDRLYRAFEGVDYVIHAAAMKQVPASEYNPFEAVMTNINGAQNVINAAIDTGVERVIALSTDKACAPISLYGATKLVSDKLFINGNAYAGRKKTSFAVVRYGNVVGSRGSVVPLFKRLARDGASEVPITDERMTRFWITLPQGVQFVLDSLERSQGGELFVPKIPSMKVVDLAQALLPKASIKIIGVRPGEKLHEEMISANDARNTHDVEKYFVIAPDANWWRPAKNWSGKLVPDGYSYNSRDNTDWLTAIQLQEMVADA